MNQEERFLSKVVRVPWSGCWIWNASLKSSGYGAFRLTSKAGERPLIVRAHRFSFEMFKGPLNGLYVLHTCDVRCCVNPDHLFAGTQQDNVDDMVAKGRQPYRKGRFPGVRPRKLSTEDHATIALSVEKRRVLADQYGVTPSLIGWIQRTKRLRPV